MGHIQGANRHEAIACPQRLDEDSAADTPGRFLEALVDALDLEALGFRHVGAAATGRPSDQPGALLTRDIDGDRSRVRSSRRLEQETPRHVALMWLLTKLRPDHNTIANVRGDHRTPRRDVCRTCTLVCQQRDLCGGALVVIDGSKFRAVNAKGRHFTNAPRAQLIAQIDARVAGELTELQAADDHDEAGPPGGARAADLQTKIAARRERRRRDKNLQAALAGRGHDQRSRTEPASRAMQGGAGGGPAVCSHVQTAVEAPHQLIVACDGTNAPTDRDWLSPMAVEAKAVLGGPFEAVAEVGYDHGQEVTQGLQVGMTPSRARPIPSAHQTLGLFSTDDFTYEAATETYRCPAGAGLSGRFATIEQGRPMRYDATSACRPCALKAQGTRHQGGRRITRWVDEARLEPMAPRVHARPELMQPRQERVEPPCGTMKRSWHQGDVLLRGLAKVGAALSVTVLADHLRRVLNRVALPRLLASLGEGWQGGRGRWWARRRDA